MREKIYRWVKMREDKGEKVKMGYASYNKRVIETVNGGRKRKTRGKVVTRKKGKVKRRRRRKRRDDKDK